MIFLYFNWCFVKHINDMNEFKFIWHQKLIGSRKAVYKTGKFKKHAYDLKVYMYKLKVFFQPSISILTPHRADKWFNLLLTTFTSIFIYALELICAQIICRKNKETTPISSFFKSNWYTYSDKGCSSFQIAQMQNSRFPLFPSPSLINFIHPHRIKWFFMVTILYIELKKHYAVVHKNSHSFRFLVPFFAWDNAFP